MREILFRGKRLDNGKWVEGYYIKMGETYIEYCDAIYGPVQKEVYPKTVGQFTGLTDKNGKRIFEGDFVKDEYRHYYVVDYDEKRGGFYPFARGDGCGCCEDKTIWDATETEIIGNIYSNPEILKKAFKKE